MIRSWEASLGHTLLSQVRQRPEANAVICGDRRLSYRALGHRALAVARGLAARGIGPESLVGVAFERSTDAVIAITAVALTGAAYVPLNPQHPLPRLSWIAENAGLSLIVGGAGLPAVEFPADLLALSDVERSGSASPQWTMPNVDGSSLAYVMYTSGSTGRPKGVMVEQRGVLRLVVDTDYVHFGPGERVVQAAALEFDASTWEIWGALLNGGTLIVADRDEALVPTRYAELLRRQAATSAWLTAPLFRQFANEDPDMFTPLRQLIVGGDVVSPEHVRAVLARHPGLCLYNGYGPTENTTFTTVHRLRAECEEPLPIGRPIPGTQVMVCDERLRAVPAGVIGELCVAGAGLARGYCREPELTAQKFVAIDGERYYRTGDRVHVDADGVLHFHGRTDGQVKIRGHLVELAEVTAALLAVPGVRDGHVSVVPDAVGENTLVAHVVLGDTTAGSAQRALAAQLPSFLCPERYVVLERLPLNDNGKVDAARLPKPAAPNRAGAALDLDPDLAALWGQVLGLPAASLGPADHFFELGGSSITLGTLLGRIRLTMGAQLTYVDASRALTFAAMSAAVADAARRPEPQIGAVADLGDLHPHQRAIYALWQLDPESVAYNIPFCVELSGPVDPARLSDALNQTVARHDAFWMRFTEEGGLPRQHPVPASPIPVPLLPAAPVAQPFRLDDPPLLRAGLVPLAADLYQLYVDVHHTVFDGVSLRVFVEELLAIYAGQEPPPPRVSYLRVAQWAHDQWRQGEHARSEAYWRERFASPPPRLRLGPGDRGNAGRPGPGAVHRRPLKPALSSSIDVAARRHGTSAYVVLLSAYVATLARLCGQPDLAVGTPVSGRYHSAVQDVVGMFAATVCVRPRLGADDTFYDLVSQVDRLAAEAITHSGSPVTTLGLPSPGQPLFDAFFAYQNIDFHRARRGSLTASTRLLNPGTTRFDLNLQVYPRPDGVALELEHATDLIDAGSAAYVVDQYIATLERLCAEPAGPVQPAHAVAATASPDFDL